MLGPYAGHLGELFHRGAAHAVQVAKAVQQPVGQGIHIPLGNGVKQQQFQHHMGLHMVKAAFQKPVFQPLAVAGVHLTGGFCFVCHAACSFPGEWEFCFHYTPGRRVRKAVFMPRGKGLCSPHGRRIMKSEPRPDKGGPHEDRNHWKK